MRALAAVTGLLALALALAPATATAAMNCSGSLVPQPLQLPSTVVAPVAPELVVRASQLGMPSGVLAPGNDASQALDRVLLRLQIEGCRDLAKAAAPASPDDPAAYRPQTEFDNTPWRFDMSQGANA